MLIFDENSLSTPSGSSIRWDEVVAVHAEKIDAITHELTTIILDHECGESVEFQIDDAGFDSLKDELVNLLPLPNNWFDLVVNLAPRSGINLMAR